MDRFGRAVRRRALGERPVSSGRGAGELEGEADGFGDLGLREIFCSLF
jgi:hypothetical protein